MTVFRNSPPFFVGIDLGGTNIKSGVVDNDGRPMSSVSIETHAEQGGRAGLDRLVEAANQAVDEKRPQLGSDCRRRPWLARDHGPRSRDAPGPAQPAGLG